MRISAKRIKKRDAEIRRKAMDKIAYACQLEELKMARILSQPPIEYHPLCLIKDASDFIRLVRQTKERAIKWSKQI